MVQDSYSAVQPLFIAIILGTEIYKNNDNAVIKKIYNKFKIPSTKLKSVNDHTKKKNIIEIKTVEMWKFFCSSALKVKCLLIRFKENPSIKKNARPITTFYYFYYLNVFNFKGLYTIAFQGVNPCFSLKR